jgi:hypothetical protein
MINISLLENFIKNIILENEVVEKEKEIIDDFLSSNMYKNIKKIIESSQNKIAESKNNEEIITNENQISRIHKSLESHLGGIKSSIELNEMIEALSELKRIKSNKDFHQRKANINKFLNKAGIALETAPFLFILIYLFNTQNDILSKWCVSNNITLTNSLVSFLAMFLFGKLLRSGRKEKIRMNQDAADLYSSKKQDVTQNFKKLKQ